jgi:hypothetical protein
VGFLLNKVVIFLKEVPVQIEKNDDNYNMYNEDTERLCSSLYAVYNNSSYQEQMSLIFGFLHYKEVFLKKYYIILKKLKEGLEHNLSSPNINIFINSLLSISSLIENEEFLVDLDIIPLLFSFINQNKTEVSRNALFLLCNICSVPDKTKKNMIINLGVFQFFSLKLLELSFSTSSLLIPDNIIVLLKISHKISNLLKENEEGVRRFLDSPLIPCLLQIFRLETSIENTENGLSHINEIIEIQKNIINSFCECTYSLDNTSSLINHGILELLLMVLEKKMNDDNDVIKNESSSLLLKITEIGFKEGEGVKYQKNKFQIDFNKINGLNRLINIYDMFEHVPIKKYFVNNVVLSVLYLLKQEKPPKSCYNLLKYASWLKDCLYSDFGKLFTKAWKEITDPDSIIKIYKNSFH